MSERWPQFDIKRDNELIAAGTHFWCSACVVARPIDDQSPDPRYCLSCYEIIKNEKKIDSELKQNRDSWTPDGMTFIHYGKGYCISPDGDNICIGQVDAAGAALGDVFSAPDKHPGKEKGVTKIEHEESVGVNDSQAQDGGIYVTSEKEHRGRGRPRKDGDDVCRMTEWRRKKEAETQGVLL